MQCIYSTLNRDPIEMSEGPKRKKGVKRKNEHEKKCTIIAYKYKPNGHMENYCLNLKRERIFQNCNAMLY